MRYSVLLFLPLLMLSGTADAQPQNGLVPFDYSDAPIVEFQFDLDRSTIVLIMEGTDPHIASLFNTLVHLHLRNYKASHFDKILRHYGTNLKARGWSVFEKSANFHLYTLTQNETVIGIFAAVRSGKEIYLINMDGQFAPKQVSELLGNLDALGIEIPELTAFGARSASVSPSTVLRTPEGDPIHEVRIQANQKTAEPQIRAMLEEGPDELSAVMATLRSKLPDTQTLTVRVDTEGSKRIATIIVVEKKLSSNYYLHATPLVQFNRVTGLLPAARLEVGKRRQMGPLYLWYIPSSVRERLTKLSGDIGYGFGNRHINYRVGGDIIRGEPDISTLGFSAQIYRATNVTAPNLLPYYDNLSTAWANLWGAPNVHNYYLSEGAELSFRWEPVGPTHSLKLMMRTESHESLQKTTDWYMGNWASELEARENPPITPGQLRSVTLRYDLSTHRNSNIGWHNTFFVEHSNPVVGSDFDFTRFRLQLRYVVSKGNNLIRTRLALGAATGTLPIQRQFFLGGTGTLNGYPPYAFSGDYGALLNMEYLYRLSNLYHWSWLKETFILLFLDQGQVWNTSDKPYRFDPKTSVGIGWQSGEDYVFRLYVSKALESGRQAEVISTWYYSF